MPEDDLPRNELPEKLAEIVAGIARQPVPQDLEERIRLRWDATFDGRTQRPKFGPRFTLVAGMLAVAAIGALFVFLFPTATKEPTPRISVARENSITQTQTLAGDSAVTSTEGPSLWTYHNAASVSIDQLNGRLADHAHSVLSSTESASPRAYLFARTRSWEEF